MADDELNPIRKIIRDAGGAAAIALAVSKQFPARARGAPALSADAVYKWQSIGIPDRYWPLIIELTGVTPADLYEANRSVREVAA